MPPPWSSSFGRSSEMRIFGARRVGEMRLDLVGEPMHVDDRPLDAVLGQAIEAIIDQRAAVDLDERLRAASR